MSREGKPTTKSRPQGFYWAAASFMKWPRGDMEDQISFAYGQAKCYKHDVGMASLRPTASGSLLLLRPLRILTYFMSFDPAFDDPARQMEWQSAERASNVVPMHLEPRPEQAKLIPAIIFNGFLAWFAGFLHLFITGSTAEFRTLVLIWSLILTAGLAIPLFLGTMLVAFTVGLLQKSMRVPAWITGRLVLRVGVGIVLFAVLLGLNNARAKTRLMKATGGAGAGAANVQVTGFNSFLANRWLYSFDATEEDVASIASRLELEPMDGINLKASLANDAYFLERASSVITDIPGKDESLGYAKSLESGQSVQWTTLVFSPSLKRAWLHTGFQN